MALWLVRSGRHGEGDELALTSGVVGIGWAQAGDLSGVTTIERLRERLTASYPDAKASTLTNWVGQVDAFQRRIAIDDLVALPLKGTPAVAFGRVTGPYRYAPEAPESMRHQRSVSWIREDVPRESIAQDILYSLGAFLTVCRIQRNDAETRIKALLEGAVSPRPADPAPEIDQPASDVVRQPDVDLAELSRDQIRRRIGARFHGHDLSRLIGAVLQAEGMFVHVSPAGPDGGVDILAGEGDMGFDGVGLAVQVESGGIVVDASTLRELQGVMTNFGATRGLMVSWGRYTKNARAEARRLFFQLRLWDADDVIARVEAVYERLPQDIQAELPLRRMWTLVPDEDS
ncbi:restriction endonuclease [Geodermatophilus sp. SYSU D00700]